MSYTDPFNGHKIIDDQHRYKEQTQPLPPFGCTYMVATKPLTTDEWKAQLLDGHLNMQPLHIHPALFIGLFRNSLKLKIDNPFMNVSYPSPSGVIETGADELISGISLFETPIEPFDYDAEAWEVVYLVQVTYP